MEAGIQPGQTVPYLLLYIVYFGVPLVIIIVRQILMKRGFWSGSGTFVDAFLGLVFSLALCTMITNAITVLVGRPRPNYFALHALVQFGGSDLFSYQEANSIRSFPSGHSSQSMAGTFYVTLLCWADLPLYAGARNGWRRSLLAYLSLLPALVSVWVGVTQIRDYWNFQDDVLAGWTIGVFSAFIAVRWITFPEDKPFTSDAKNTFFASITDMTYGSVDQGAVAAS